MYLFLGAILDTWAMVILTLPFVYPIILNLGFSPIWFGVFIVIMMEIATITPPVGIIALMMHDLVPDVPLSKIFLNCVPFVLIGLLLVTLITIFPEIVMYLPELQQKR
jgi:TRAP-type C4-dicarboxylate transport system permease large subunit